MKLCPHRVVVLARFGAVASGCAMWIATGSLLAIVSRAGAASAADGGPVTQDAIAISLPIFVTAVIATAVFTWTIARYDLGRNVRIRNLERRMDRILNDSEESEVQPHHRPRRRTPPEDA